MLQRIAWHPAQESFPAEALPLMMQKNCPCLAAPSLGNASGAAPQWIMLLSISVLKQRRLRAVKFQSLWLLPAL